LIQAVDDLGLEGRLAVVTAGWEERESEDQELSDHLRGRSVNLKLWERTEAVYQRDPALHQAIRQRVDASLRIRELYRLRLDHALEAARALQLRSWSPEWLAHLQDELDAALEALRKLDDDHQLRMRELYHRFEEEHRPGERPAVIAVRKEIERELEHCDGVCIAGGNVRVLLHRMRLFEVPRMLRRLPIIAWSAGSMAVCERVVLFHDRPPQGSGNTEVLDEGLGLCPGLVAFPHADKRLLLDDAPRLMLLAKRLAPRLCAVFTARTRMDWDGHRWRAQPGTRAIGLDGRLEEVSTR
jgi:hypothetical protein